MEVTNHKFKLISGVECEVKELTGKQQRILTENNGKTTDEKFALMIQSILVRVGSVINPDLVFIDNLLSGDRKKILEEARKFSMRGTEQANLFIFNFPYTDAKGNKQKHELDVELTEGFPVKPYKTIVDGVETIVDVDDYSKIEKEVYTILPRSGKKVRFYLLDGNREKVGASVKKEARSSHTTIMMRNPQYFEKGEGGSETPVQVNLDKLALVDIEHLRKLIDNVEGGVDTIVEFEHPEAARLPQHEKTVKADLLAQTAFFFPSEAI